MAVTSLPSGGGTQTCTIGTEHTLVSVNAAGVYQCWLDKSNMAALDSVELRVYRIVKTGGTTRVVHVFTFYGVQGADDQVFRTEGMSNPHTDTDALKFTLKQTGGASGKAFDYCVDKSA